MFRESRRPNIKDALLSGTLLSSTIEHRVRTKGWYSGKGAFLPSKCLLESPFYESFSEPLFPLKLRPEPPLTGVFVPSGTKNRKTNLKGGLWGLNCLPESPRKSGKEKAHKHKQIVLVTARAGGVSRPGGQGSPDRWPGVKSLCAVCATQGT